MCLTPISTTLPVLPSKHIYSVLKLACDAQHCKDGTNTSVIVGLVSLFNREQLGNGCVEKTVHVVWTRYVVDVSRLCAESRVIPSHFQETVFIQSRIELYFG